MSFWCEGLRAEIEVDDVADTALWVELIWWDACWWDRRKVI